MGKFLIAKGWDGERFVGFRGTCVFAFPIPYRETAAAFDFWKKHPYRQSDDCVFLIDLMENK